MSAAIRVVLPAGSPHWTLTRYVGGSIAGHLLLVAGAVLLAASHRRPLIPEDAIVVGLAAAPAGPSAAPQDGGTGLTPPPPSSSDMRMDAELPKPKPKSEKKKDEKRPAPKDEPRPVPVAAPTRPSAAAGGADSPAGAGPPGSAGSSIVAVEGGDARFAWYRDRVISAIQSRWVRPVLEGSSGTLSVVVTFEIDRDGTVRNVEVRTSSGVPSLDRSALAAVEDASPLPPLPAAWGAPPYPARFEFRWSPAGNR